MNDMLQVDPRCSLDIDDVTILIDHYRVDELRWQGDVGSEHLVEFAHDRREYWEGVRERWLDSTTQAMGMDVSPPVTFDQILGDC